VQLCLGSFLVIMLVEEIGYTLVAAGVLLSITQGAGVVGRVIMGLVHGSPSRRRWYGCCG
jgi:hypothetical protein